MLTYRQALEAIFQRADYERGDRPPYPERVWRLARVEELLSQIGDPHRAYPSVHIAGTKGKGSTTAMIESILRAAGFRTGMYTSPHLHTFRERIQIEGAPISEEEVSAHMEELIPILKERPEVTVFEIITALAMKAFRARGVAWGVFEVGMGGRLDATNVLLPEVAVITSISLDHVNVLGHTLDAIAREKAGIIKEGRPVVSAPQRPEALEVIERTAH
ncbi:MAG: bifunctional folylpolyglutamate synthase/dihydrofolate synthase, partial [Chloroflexi bacterium]|nr:bifunctional folylpolyglutamate synthase/dihydrofolate synthase [Chloroflexota bacterium]